MIISGTTILSQCGTQFRTGIAEELSSGGIVSSLQKLKSPILKTGTQQVIKKGAMSMVAKIEIHDDYCSNLDNAEIETILSQITALITDAVLRAVSQFEDAA